MPPARRRCLPASVEAATRLIPRREDAYRRDELDEVPEGPGVVACELLEPRQAVRTVFGWTYSRAAARGTLRSFAR